MVLKQKIAKQPAAEMATHLPTAAVRIEAVSEKTAGNQQTLWAKVGDGRWYAIPDAMAESFRKAGAEVRQAAAELGH